MLWNAYSYVATENDHTVSCLSAPQPTRSPCQSLAKLHQNLEYLKEVKQLLGKDIKDQLEIIPWFKVQHQWMRRWKAPPLRGVWV